MISTADRVPCNTAPEINKRIRKMTERNIAYYGSHPEEIDQRLAELDQEWDVERVIETQASSLILGSTFLGFTMSRKWYIFTAIVGGFLLQHAIQGWCPPVPVLRRAGFRTQTEIDSEKYALKAMRGDFRNVSEGQRQSVGRATTGGPPQGM
ncbi:MAG TPA: DUF2892 domain-containing protein [Planctomycetota bacterium]|jgi:hypothetical protein